MLTIDEGLEGVTRVCPSRNAQHIFCATEKTNDVKMFHVPSKTLVKTLSGEYIASFTFEHSLGHLHYILRMTDPDRIFSSMSGEMKIKIKFFG